MFNSFSKLSHTDDSVTVASNGILDEVVAVNWIFEQETSRIKSPWCTSYRYENDYSFYKNK